MELKALLSLEIKKNDKTYTLVLPAGCPYGEAYDVVYEMLLKIHEMSKQAMDQVKPVHEGE